MPLDDVDPHLKYLVLIIAFIAVAGAYHNYTMTEDDTFSIGYCETSIECSGYEVSGVCIGIEHLDTHCIHPDEAEEWQTAEAECAVTAQGLCNANPEMDGLDWTDHGDAEHDGQTCADWEAAHEDFTLLTCEATFRDVTHWE